MSKPRRSTPKPSLVLQVEPQHQEQLRQLAESLGFLVPSGTNTGKGNISALVTAIAQHYEDIRSMSPRNRSRYINKLFQE